MSNISFYKQMGESKEFSQSKREYGNTWNLPVKDPFFKKVLNASKKEKLVNEVIRY